MPGEGRGWWARLGQGPRVRGSLSLELVFKLQEESTQMALVVKNLPANAGDVRDRFNP